MGHNVLPCPVTMVTMCISDVNMGQLQSSDADFISHCKAYTLIQNNNLDVAEDQLQNILYRNDTAALFHRRILNGTMAPIILCS